VAAVSLLTLANKVENIDHQQVWAVGMSKINQSIDQSINQSVYLSTLNNSNTKSETLDVYNADSTTRGEDPLKPVTSKI